MGFDRGSFLISSLFYVRTHKTEVRESYTRILVTSEFWKFLQCRR